MTNTKHALIISTVMLFASMVILGGCASSRSGQVYTRDQARQEMRVSYGTVLSVHQVQIEGTQSGIGAVAGGVTGGVAGSMVGGGTGRVLGAVGGALLGAGVGALAEEGITRKTGLEIGVELDSGEVLSIVQEADVPYYPGERVRVLRGYDGSSRVQKM